RALLESGIKLIEVPLNSPDPYESIRLLSKDLEGECLCGAGTVLNPEQVDMVYEAGGRLIVSPNTNLAVIARTLEKSMVSMPGCYTPTEAFDAVSAGASFLKLFPADSAGIGHLKAIKTVLPQHIRVIATGGVDASNMSEWFAAGVSGLGVGGSLYKPGISLVNLRSKAEALVAGYCALES
ncbi:MAG: 2-dehydro-3-deoxy-6-phosphogalactonate aldolase, partial [Kordiimonas sp.]